MTPPPKLLDRVRDAVRTRHYSRRTEEAYVGWIRRYIVFHRKTHPAQMGASEVSRFLTWLAVDRPVSALLGHRDFSTTMTYLHVLPRGALGVRSPMDRLCGGYARSSRLTTGAPDHSRCLETVPRQWLPDILGITCPVDTRHDRRVSTPVPRYSLVAFARNHRGGRDSLPARIRFQSEDYGDE